MCQPPLLSACHPNSVSAHINDGLRERLWIFLGHVVPDARKDTMRISAGKLAGVGFSICSDTVEIARNGDGRDRDRRSLEQFLFELAVLRFAVSHAQAPAVVVNYDVDMVGIFERSCCPV